MMRRTLRARVAGAGHHLPGPPVSNEELIARHGLRVRADAVERCVGIVTRHFAPEGVSTSDLAVEAAVLAIEASGIARRDLRRIFLATVSGDFPTPATSCVVQHKLGLSGRASVDIVGACSGFVQAMDLAARCVTTGEGPALVIGADIRSRQVDFQDPQTAFLYGDGAGAVVLAEASGEDGLWHSILTADGAGAEAVCIPAGGSREPLSHDALDRRRHLIAMPDGRRVAEAARTGFRLLLDRLLEETGLAAGDLGYFLLHQPNLRLIERMRRDLGIEETRMWVNFPRYGNTTSATLPIALSEADRAGRLVPDSWVCLGAVGAGFAGGIQLIRWGGPCT